MMYLKLLVTISILCIISNWYSSFELCNYMYIYYYFMFLSKEKQENLEYTGMTEKTVTGSSALGLHKLSLEQEAEELIASKELGSYSLETAVERVPSRYMHKIS